MPSASEETPPALTGRTATPSGTSDWARNASYAVRISWMSRSADATSSTGAHIVAMRFASSPPTDCVALIAASKSAKQPPRPVKQRAAGDRQLHRMGRAPQHLAAQQALERPDLPAQRRLRDIQPRGGATEVELLGDGDERPQVLNLDAVGGLGEREDVAAHAAEYARPTRHR